MPLLSLTFRSRILVMAIYKLVKTIHIVRLPFLIFLILISKASNIAYSFASNKSFFFPKYCLFFCYLFDFFSNYTILDPAFSIFNLDLSV